MKQLKTVQIDEGFNDRFRDIEISEFFDGMFVHGSSHADCDGDKGIYFPSIVLCGNN